MDQTEINTRTNGGIGGSPLWVSIKYVEVALSQLKRMFEYLVAGNPFLHASMPFFIITVGTAYVFRGSPCCQSIA